MRMAMRFVCVQTQRMKMCPQLNQEIRQLLRLEKRFFRHKAFPTAARGKDGLRIAHETLCERNAMGILIGGLAESVWRGWSWRRLEKHKDVDVLVLSDQFELKHEFESGIDWWLPRHERVRAASDAGELVMPATFWENCNGVCLNFGAAVTSQSPGLYLPGSDFLYSMRSHEVFDGIKHPADPSQDAYTRFESLLSRRYKGVCQHLCKFFDGRVLGARSFMPNSLSDPPETGVGIIRHSFDVLAGIRAGQFLH